MSEKVFLLNPQRYAEFVDHEAAYQPRFAPTFGAFFVGFLLGGFPGFGLFYQEPSIAMAMVGLLGGLVLGGVFSLPGRRFNREERLLAERGRLLFGEVTGCEVENWVRKTTDSDIVRNQSSLKMLFRFEADGQVIEDDMGATAWERRPIEGQTMAVLYVDPSIYKVL